MPQRLFEQDIQNSNLSKTWQLKKYAVILSLPLLMACGGGGGSSTPTTPVAPPPAADTTAPTASFSPASITLESGTTINATLTTSDNVGVTSTDVTCTTGSFASGVYTAPTVTADTTGSCTATVSDAAGNSATATLNVTITAPPTSTGDVTISGKATYDSVPHNTVTNGLNYNAITQLPIRGATLELLDGSGAVLTRTTTDDNGDYSVTVASNTNVRVRVRSELLSSGPATWDVKVTDNTNGNAVYALQGSLTSSGTTDTTRNLNAASGWTGAGYTDPRNAAPFAILDPIYDAVTAFVAVDNDMTFPPVELRWSTLNRAESGDRAAGQIGTSSYVREAGSTQGNIFILGDENSDTDEYDSHVIVHEWGHYFEDQLSRSDSIGGPHSAGQRLDPRLAMGEGWGNALSGIILGDPIYRDSLGTQQANGFSINVENNNYSNEGWYNEGSTQAIIYDLFDSDDDGADTVSLGLAPIYEIMTSDVYTNTSFFTTIFNFLDVARTQQTANAAEINALAADQTINGTGADGSGETNNGNTPTALPLYRSVAVNGAAVEVCSVINNGASNKLGVRNYLTLDINTPGAYTFTMTRTSGATNRDPDYFIYENGTLRVVAQSGAVDTETSTNTLTVGSYAIDAYEFKNVENGSETGDSCFDFTVTG